MTSQRMRALVPPITPAARSEVQAEQHQLKSQQGLHGSQRAVARGRDAGRGWWFLAGKANKLKVPTNNTPQRLNITSSFPPSLP
jgi:hypothetical protein